MLCCGSNGRMRGSRVLALALSRECRINSAGAVHHARLTCASARLVQSMPHQLGRCRFIVFNHSRPMNFTFRADDPDVVTLRNCHRKLGELSAQNGYINAEPLAWQASVVLAFYNVVQKTHEFIQLQKTKSVVHT